MWIVLLCGPYTLCIEDIFTVSWSYHSPEHQVILQCKLWYLTNIHHSQSSGLKLHLLLVTMVIFLRIQCSCSFSLPFKYVRPLQSALLVSFPSAGQHTCHLLLKEQKSNLDHGFNLGLTGSTEVHLEGKTGRIYVV